MLLKDLLCYSVYGVHDIEFPTFKARYSFEHDWLRKKNDYTVSLNSLTAQYETLGKIHFGKRIKPLDSQLYVSIPKYRIPSM